MAIHYYEFDTTVQDVVRDIKARILLNPDWSYQGLDTAIGTSSANAALNASSMTFPSGSLPAALTIGSTVRIDSYASNKSEYRTLTNVTATTISWSGGLLYAHASGTPIYWGNEVLRTTTVRGAPMIVDLTGGVSNSENTYRMAYGAYGGWTPPTTTTAGVISDGWTAKYSYWRRTAGPVTSLVHVVVSTSKDHIYISVEGPRPTEPSPSNSTWGSLRSYFFMSDLVPYSPNDTIPCVAVGGLSLPDAGVSPNNKTHVVNLSKSFDGTKNWVEAVPLALQFPAVNTTTTVTPQRLTKTDGTTKFYLSPYVIADDEVGFRGRLSSFFNAGATYATTGENYNTAVDSEVVYNGVTYKMLAVSRNDASSAHMWGPFGAVNNNSTDYYVSPVVAIPFA